MSRQGGLSGMQYQKKSFTVPMGNTGDDKIGNVMSDEDKERIEHDAVFEKEGIVQVRKRRHILPFGDRILVRRRKVGEKLGSGIIVAPQKTQDTETEIADVVFVPEHTFADKELCEKSESIVSALIISAKNGNSDALISLLRYNDYLKIKTLRPGDVVLISKYVGITFYTSDDASDLTMVNNQDIIGLVVEEVS